MYIYISDIIMQLGCKDPRILKLFGSKYRNLVRVGFEPMTADFC